MRFRSLAFAVSNRDSSRNFSPRTVLLTPAERQAIEAFLDAIDEHGNR